MAQILKGAPVVAAMNEANAARCAALKEKGIEPKAMGVEVISDAILAKGVAAAAKFNFDNTVKVLQEGWPEAMPEK